MKRLVFFLGWAALSFAYWVCALVVVAYLVGREEGSNALIGLAVAFALWVTISLRAVRALRMPKG